MKFSIYDLRFTRVSSFSRRIASCVFFLAVLSHSTAHGQDTALERQIVGTWTKGKSVEICIYTNGSFRTKIFKVYPNVTKTVDYGGTWQIKDGFCIFTVTNAGGIGTTNFESVGSVDHMKIINVDKTSLVWSFNDQTMAYLRK